MTAWRVAGLIPFMRRPHWIQLAKEKKAEKLEKTLKAAGVTALNLNALSLPGSKRRQPNSPDASDSDEDGADADGAKGETTSGARLVASDLAMLPGGPLSQAGIKLAQLKAAVGEIKKLDAQALKVLLTQKNIRYQTVDQAKLEVMNITAQDFGHAHVPLNWLPAALKALQMDKLGIAPDAAAAQPKGKGKKPARVFAWGTHKAAADLLVSRSAAI